jgi:hypothetical protein
MIPYTSRATRALCLSLACLLCMAMATVAHAASADRPGDDAPRVSAPAASPPDEKLQQLEEIWIHGKRLAHRIEDAEDEFFPLYNKANKNHDFDIHCGYAYLRPDTMIMGRACTTNLFSRYDPPPNVYWGPCSSLGYPGGVYVPIIACLNSGGYEPLSIEFILMARGEDIRKNMLKVIGSDPALMEKAAHLGDLYFELSSVQNRYRTAKGIRVKGNSIRKLPLKPAKASSGPRSM